MNETDDPDLRVPKPAVDAQLNATLDDIFQDNPKVGTVGIYEKYIIVIYFIHILSDRS